MRRPVRNLLYVVLGFACVALLVQGAGLKLPVIMQALTAVSGAASTAVGAVPASGSSPAWSLTREASTHSPGRTSSPPLPPPARRSSLPVSG